MKRAVIIGVAALLSLSIVLGTLAAGSAAILISGLFFGGANKGSNNLDAFLPNINDAIGDADEAEKDNENAEDVLYSTTSLSLSSLKDSTEHLRTEQIALFDGTKKLIWKYSDESGYRAKELTDIEYEKLLDLIISDGGTNISTEDSMLDGIWISLGDGRVISPELKDAEEKMGYGELFKYTPEYMPSAQFNEYMCSVIAK